MKTTKTLGRPVGAGSFQSVGIKDIVKYMGEESQIPVSRIWWENVKRQVLSESVNHKDPRFYVTIQPTPEPEPVKEEPKLTLTEIHEQINKEFQKRNRV